MAHLEEARLILLDFEGRGIEHAIVHELVVPEIDGLLGALNLESDQVRELLDTRHRVWFATSILAKAARAFEQVGAYAIAGAIGNAAWAVLQAVPR